MASGTPPAWRVAALAVLAGGLTVGVAAGRSRRTRWIVGLAAILATGQALPIAAASRRPPIAPAPPQSGPTTTSTPEPAATPGSATAGPGAPALESGSAPTSGPTFSVLVAARNEAAVLPALVADLAAQDHRTGNGTPLFEVIVIDDRSTDGTGAAALRAAAMSGIEAHLRVVRREGRDLPDGKGAALTAAQPDACRGDVIVVLDADARIGPTFLSRVAHYVSQGADALTARRRILDAHESWLAGAQADEQTLDGEIQRGRWALGGCSEFRGNGIVIRRDLLASLGGWRPEPLTEDLDLSSRLAAEQGHNVAWALDVEVWEEPVRTLAGLWRQRDRWAEGALRRTLKHLPRVLRSRRLSQAARLDFAAYCAQLAVPPILLGTLAGAILRRRPGPTIGLGLTYLGVGSILAWDALRWETDTAGGPLEPCTRAGRALRVGAFNGIWLLVVPGALWRIGTRHGPVEYAKMEHVGGGTGEWAR